MITFLLGLIIGLLINPVKNKFKEETVDEVVAKILGQKAQFLEPITNKEKFEQAETVSDLIEK